MSMFENNELESYVSDDQIPYIILSDNHRVQITSGEYKEILEKMNSQDLRGDGVFICQSGLFFMDKILAIVRLKKKPLPDVNFRGGRIKK